MLGAVVGCLQPWWLTAHSPAAQRCIGLSMAMLASAWVSMRQFFRRSDFSTD